MDVFVIARYLGALLVTLALMGAALYAVRRFFPQVTGALAAPLGQGLRRTPQRRLNVTETLTLDPRRRVSVLRWDDREYLVLLGAAGEQLLSDRPAQEEAAAPHDPGARS